MSSTRVCFQLTGFGPFHDKTERLFENPSEALVSGAALPEQSSQTVLRVAVRSAVDAATALPPSLPGFLTCRLHVGVDTTRDFFKLESRAVNVCAFRAPDEDGWWPTAEQPAPVLDSEPFGAVEDTTLDVAALLAVLLQPGGGGEGAACGERVESSSDAGRFVCNALYYASLVECRKRRALQSESSPRGDEHALFLHIPTFAAVGLERQRVFLAALMDAVAAQLAR